MISDSTIAQTLSAYLEIYPRDAEPLAEPARLLSQGTGFASRRNFSMHVTAGALLVRGQEVLLIEHRAYGGIVLQPGGHLEPTDASLLEAALRELTEETGVDPATVVPASTAPVYIEYGAVPARADRDEPAHHHLDIGYAFTTVHGDVGRIQESEVLGAFWYPIATAEQLVGPRISRAQAIGWGG